jgi:hypothetical protein
VRICTRLPFGEGGTCDNTISDAPYEMNEAEVNKLITEGGMVYFSARDYGDVKKFIIEACLRSKKCDQKKTEEKFNNLEGFVLP